MSIRAPCGPVCDLIDTYMVNATTKKGNPDSKIQQNAVESFDTSESSTRLFSGQEQISTLV